MWIFPRRPRPVFSIPLADVPWPVLWLTLGDLETRTLRQVYLAHPRFAQNILIMNRHYMRKHRIIFCFDSEGAKIILFKENDDESEKWQYKIETHVDGILRLRRGVKCESFEMAAVHFDSPATVQRLLAGLKPRRFVLKDLELIEEGKEWIQSIDFLDAFDGIPELCVNLCGVNEVTDLMIVGPLQVTCETLEVTFDKSAFFALIRQRLAGFSVPAKVIARSEKIVVGQHNFYDLPQILHREKELLPWINRVITVFARRVRLLKRLGIKVGGHKMASSLVICELTVEWRSSVLGQSQLVGVKVYCEDGEVAVEYVFRSPYVKKERRPVDMKTPLKNVPIRIFNRSFLHMKQDKLFKFRKWLKKKLGQDSRVVGFSLAPYNNLFSCADGCLPALAVDFAAMRVLGGDLLTASSWGLCRLASCLNCLNKPVLE